MAILRSCCCWLSVRKGSFACGIYTLIFYTMLVVTGIFHVNSVLHSPVGFTLVLLLLSFSGLCVIFSVVLLLGLFLDNRLLLIPWLSVVSMTTLLDVVLSVYFVLDLRIDPFVVAMYVVDYTLCSVNIYAILCVLSQYQEYAVGRRAMGQKGRAALPVLSGYSSRNDRSKLSSVATWPSRMQPQTKTTGNTSTQQIIPQTVVVCGEKTACTATKPALRGSSAVPEVTSAFACGPEELSSGVHISTAETSLQPSGEEADSPGKLLSTDMKKMEEGNAVNKLSLLDARNERAAELNQKVSHSKAALLSPLPETRPLLQVVSCTTTDCRDDGLENGVCV
ncbi:uncharacterized protein LOC144173270 [Haemaphysalis longicornis]